MNSRTIRVVILLTFIVGCGLFLWWRDVASDRSYKLEILMPITLLKIPPQSYSDKNIEVGKIMPGEKVEVLRMRYGKDFRTWLVKGSKGQEGWFVEDNTNIRVSKPTQ